MHSPCCEIQATWNSNHNYHNESHYCCFSLHFRWQKYTLNSTTATNSVAKIFRKFRKTQCDDSSFRQTKSIRCRCASYVMAVCVSPTTARLHLISQSVGIIGSLQRWIVMLPLQFYKSTLIGAWLKQEFKIGKFIQTRTCSCRIRSTSILVQLVWAALI